MGLQQYMVGGGGGGGGPITEIVSQRVNTPFVALNSNTLTWPAQPTAGNLLVCCIGANFSANIVPPAGWALAVASADTSSQILTKIAGPSEPISGLWREIAGNGSSWTMQATEFSGISSGLFDTIATANAAASTVSATNPARAVANSLLIATYRKGAIQAITVNQSQVAYAALQGAPGLSVTSAFLIVSAAAAQVMSAGATGFTSFNACNASFSGF